MLVNMANHVFKLTYKLHSLFYDDFEFFALSSKESYMCNHCHLIHDFFLGGENKIALDLIVQHVHSQLSKVGFCVCENQ